MSTGYKALERLLLGLFVASGFAGLIYQAIWSHYLGLSLGHAAYAQTLVLAIFMGGMALGAWLVSLRGVRWRRLILAYAVVEIVIGLAGIAFHPFFLAYTGFSQDVVYPALETPGVVRAWQWGSAALLIAPQSILLGMTFPLMSGGYLRLAPKADGEILGGLYFTNSIGAAFGALVATFVLLPWLGMPGTVAVAGGINLLVGVLAWRVAGRADALPPPAESVVPAPTPTPTPTGQVGTGFYRMILLAAGITGASSFVYEIGWVRMLNQALGTTVHSFELMLSAFILGLAFGGLWIRRRSQHIVDTVAYAGYAQILMGVAALASLPMFAQSFRWVGALMQVLPRDDGGYALFSLGSAGIALLVMFPAAFFAGMTLPLFTMALLRRGAGESSIGRVYAANTLGAIVGVGLAVHVLIPLLGLNLAVTLAALADIVLGFVLLRYFAPNRNAPRMLAALLLCLVAVGVSVVAGRPRPEALASGVFRSGHATLAESTRVVFLRDGKTASVAVFSQEGSVGVIATNGKPDASLELDDGRPPTDDEITMLMAAALPLAVHPEPERIAVIGWGSGLTTHTLLGSPAPRVVDSIEIERAMYDGARLFGSKVERAYEDPRGVLHIDDARTFFSTGQRRYDVIISEPSNPWVSGVASLFTRQFYRFLANHLEPGGVLVQWVQAYELNDALLNTMIAALIDEFPNVDAYLTNSGDILLLSSHEPLATLTYPAAEGSPLQRELARVGLAGTQDFEVRRLGSRELLATMVRLSGSVIHDDFHPVVALGAPKARYKGESARGLLTLLESGMPVLEMTDGRRPATLAEPVTPSASSTAARAFRVATQVRALMLAEDGGAASETPPELASRVEALRRLSATPVQPSDFPDWLNAVASVAETTISHLPAADHEGLWIAPAWFAPEGQPEPVLAVMDAYAAAARRDAPAMRSAAGAVLADIPAGAGQRVKEHMLVIAALGALAQGDAEAALALERGPGREVPASGKYGFIRAYLMAWGDQPEAGSR